MKLSENPIFITHKRLVHRLGVLAPVIIAALIGMVLLVGLGESLHNTFSSDPINAGKRFYGWVIGLEMAILILGGFNRIAQTLSEDQKAGLWDSNRLTPLKAQDIVAGYWLAPALREFYMAATLAAFGLLIVLTSGLPLTLWLGTQTLILSTALFLGLAAVLLGMAVQRSHAGVLLLLLLMAGPVSFAGPSRLITNFLLPIYGIGHLFEIAGQGSVSDNSIWNPAANIFGLHLHPILITLALQISLGLFIWRILVRKTRNPFQTLLLRWEVIAIFTLLVVTQHGLLWNVWTGNFPVVSNTDPTGATDTLLPFAQAGTVFIGIILLAFASPQPEQIRVEALRLGFRNLGGVFSRSALPLALLLTAIAAAGLFTQMMFSLVGSFQHLLVAVVNLLEIFLTFVLLLDYCRLRHQRRAIGFLVLWFFVLCIIPLILAALFQNPAAAHFSLLAPGFIALGNLNGMNSTDWPMLYKALVAHLLIDGLIFLGWRQQWNLLLERATP